MRNAGLLVSPSRPRAGRVAWFSQHPNSASPTEHEHARRLPDPRPQDPMHESAGLRVVQARPRRR